MTVPKAICLCLAALPLQAVPLAAQTACPTAADLIRGIRVDFADGAHEVFRRKSPAVTFVQGMNPDGEGYEMELSQGTYLLMYQNTEGGVALPVSRVDYDYGVEPAAMPVPVPGGRWQTNVTVTASDGPRAEPQTLANGTLTTEVIGDCVYDLIEVVIAYDTADFYMEGIHFLPELGIGYLIWNEATDLTRVPAEAVRIMALTK